MATPMLELTIRHTSWKFAELTVRASPKTPRKPRSALLYVIRRDGCDERRIGEFDMDVRRQGPREVLLTLTG